MVVVFVTVSGGAAFARDPDGFVPERVDTAKLHGRAPEPRERRRLYEQVEADADRGRGRVEDEQAYEARRMQDDRDERLRRIKLEREIDRFEEDVDRRRQLDAKAAREQSKPGAAAPASSIKTNPRDDGPSPMGSTLTRVVAQQSKLLEDARERYQHDLHAAEIERDEALRAARTNADRSRVTREFEQRRSMLTVAYQAFRRGILGQK